jgi:hypothetical protein
VDQIQRTTNTPYDLDGLGYYCVEENRNTRDDYDEWARLAHSVLDVHLTWQGISSHEALAKSPTIVRNAFATAFTTKKGGPPGVQRPDNMCRQYRSAKSFVRAPI